MDLKSMEADFSTIPHVYEDFGDIECEAYEDDQFQAPKFYNGSALCFIKFNVDFTLIPSHDQDSSCDFLISDSEPEQGQEQHTDLMELGELTRTDEASCWVLMSLLESIRVPPDQRIVKAIKDCPIGMASGERLKNGKGRVFGMVVDLHILRIIED